MIQLINSIEFYPLHQYLVLEVENKESQLFLTDKLPISKNNSDFLPIWVKTKFDIKQLIGLGYQSNQTNILSLDNFIYNLIFSGEINFDHSIVIEDKSSPFYKTEHIELVPITFNYYKIDGFEFLEESFQKIKLLALENMIIRKSNFSIYDSELYNNLQQIASKTLGFSPSIVSR
jgi:hypothetical protein